MYKLIFAHILIFFKFCFQIFVELSYLNYNPSFKDQFKITYNNY